MNMRYISNVIRLAVITDINHDEGFAYTRWLDEAINNGPRIPIPHPYAGQNGEGIYIGLQIGNIVALGMAAYERYIPITILPNANNYGDLDNTNEISFDNVGIPFIQSGDIILQGKRGGQLKLSSYGDIILQNQFGEGSVISGEHDSLHRCLIKTDTPVEYTISQSGIRASGLIRRDVRVENVEGDFIDFLVGLDSETALEEIGWNPEKNVTMVSEKISSNAMFRNPALVEDRQVIYEFGKDWYVGTYEKEKKRLEDDSILVTNPYNRRERRSNTQSLSLTYPNELIEKTYGNLVDIFGNLLDINKCVVPVPTGEKTEDLLKSAFESMRHTVAINIEINTRKGWGYRDQSNNRKPILLQDPTDSIMSSANNAKDRSKWFFRVDKEGLTSINVPATSETGNIPLLARHETSSVVLLDDNGNPIDKRNSTEWEGLYRNKNNQDIFLDQFGPGGITVLGKDVKNRLKNNKTSWQDNQSTSLPDIIETGTAFHDITQTAKALLNKNANKNASDIFDDTTVKPAKIAVSSVVDARIPKDGDSKPDRDENGLVIDQPNAGGRSVQANLDGSIEMSVGANTVDRVSFTLDTAGALVARLGRDRSGRSAIVHADGEVLMEIGGWDFVGEGPTDAVDERFVGRGEGRSVTLPSDKQAFRSGKIVLRIRRPNLTKTGPDESEKDNLLIIDETGISIYSAGRLNLFSEMDMTIKSKASLILDAETIVNYEKNSRFITKSGRRIA